MIGNCEHCNQCLATEQRDDLGKLCVGCVNRFDRSPHALEAWRTRRAEMRAALATLTAEERAAWAQHATAHGTADADRFLLEDYRPRFTRDTIPAPPPTEREVEDREADHAKAHRILADAWGPTIASYTTAELAQRFVEGRDHWAKRAREAEARLAALSEKGAAHGAL